MTEREAVRGLVFAAGYGSRLSPITNTRPKPLLPVLGIPLVCWAVDRLRAAGVTSIAVNMQAAHERDFRRALGVFDGLDVGISYHPEEIPRGTGGTLAALTSFWNDAPLIAMPADIISTLDLAALLADHKYTGADVTLGCFRHPWHASDFTGDIVRLDADRRRILKFQKRPGREAEGRIAATGIVAFGPSVAETISDADRLRDASSETKRPEPIDLGQDILTTIVARPDSRVQAHIVPHRFVDFGTPRQFLDGAFMALSGRLGRPPFSDLNKPLAVVDPSAEIHPGATIIGPVFIGRGVQIRCGSRIVGPVVIEDGCQIGTDTEVRECVLLPDTRLARRHRAFRMLISAHAAIGVDETSFHTEAA